ELAGALPVDEFHRHVRRLVQRLQADGGEATLARQQRATRLRLWVDPSSGMGRLAGEFDPLTYTKLHRRLAEAVNTMFHDTIPATAPSDRFARHDHLHALALAAVVGEQGVGRVGR